MQYFVRVVTSSLFVFPVDMWAGSEMDCVMATEFSIMQVASMYTVAIG